MDMLELTTKVCLALELGGGVAAVDGGTYIGVFDLFLWWQVCSHCALGFLLCLWEGCLLV